MAVTNYFNFGYSEWLTFGAFIDLMVNAQVLRLNIWLAVIFAGVATAALSLALNRGVCGPFANRRRDPFFILIVTFAIGFLLNQAYIVIWGTEYHELLAPTRRSSRSGPSISAPTSSRSWSSPWPAWRARS